MKINFISITFWFNIYDDLEKALYKFQNNLGDEFTSFNIKKPNNNLFEPLINSINKEKKSSLFMSPINLQYNIDLFSMGKFNEFKNRVMQLFEILIDLKIEVLHTAVCINSEMVVDNALNLLTNNTINKNIVTEDLVDATLKFGKKEEDLFYKILTILNKKQIKLPQKVDEKGRLVPIPLISWNGAFVENELLEISYELNDKYSFDFTKNYKTTEFFLNKMLYILENNFESDIDNLLNNGEF